MLKEILKKCNPILKNELKKTFPIYILGMLVNGLQALFHFAMPFITGEILDLVM